MTTINDAMFQNCLDTLWGIIANHPSQPEGKISFHDGFIWAEEGYKYHVYEEAHSIMMDVDWNKPGLVGSGEIIKAMFSALTVKMDHSQIHNLVDYRDIQDTFPEKAFMKMKQAEQALYNIYRTDHDEKSFADAVSVWGNAYPLISYFFFIKDSSKYAIMRPHNFAERLGRLGVSASCTTACTWKNYQQYLAILQEVRVSLNNTLNEAQEITLIDAHSFVWMFWMFDENTIISKEPMLTLPEDCDNIEIMKGGSGKQIRYLTSRYERDPKLRAKAIEIHKCVCAACDFSFESVYGELGKDYIEVHHVTPLYLAGGEVNVSPETDMVCLCANCHRMIHRKRGSIMSVDELRSILLTVSKRSIPS